VSTRVESSFIRWCGPAMILGGVSWVLSYLTEVTVGVAAGEEAYTQWDPSASLLEWLGPVFFMAGIFFLGIGLLGVRARLEGRAKWLGMAGFLLAFIAVVAASINLVLLSAVTGKATASDGLGFAGVIGVVIGSGVMGMAALRAQALPRSSRLLLALLPLVFIPTIIATIPLESILPQYAIANLPFPVVGLLLAKVGFPVLSDSQGWRRGSARTSV
jgi:uncharacterized membrane protein